MGLQITKTISAGYENLTVSGEPVRAHFGVVGYSNTLNTFIGAKATSHLVFDASNVVVTLGGGFGKMIVGPTGTALTSTSKFAETFHGSLTYPLNSHLGWQLVGYQLFHSSGTNLHVNYTQTLSTGPVIYF
jgi:hypothetical protein